MATAKKADAKATPELIVKGVDQAMWAWLMEHSPVTVPGLIEDAVERAFRSWLDTHKEMLLDKIAEKIAKNTEPGKAKPLGPG
jgi:hypothetical protein